MKLGQTASIISSYVMATLTFSSYLMLRIGDKTSNMLRLKTTKTCGLLFKLREAVLPGPLCEPDHILTRLPYKVCFSKASTKDFGSKSWEVEYWNPRVSLSSAKDIGPNNMALPFSHPQTPLPVPAPPQRYLFLDFFLESW